MDTTHTTRIARSAAAAALVAAALAGCAAQANAPVEPLEKPVAAIEPRRQVVPNDIDPRGLHGPLRDTPPAQTQPRMPVIADVDPRGLHGVPQAGTALSAAEAGASAPPTISSPVNDNDPRGLHGLPSGQ